MMTSAIQIFRGPGQKLICTVAQTQRTETMFERMRGLLGADALLPDTGLWINSWNSVHSFFMSFTIDVLYLDKNNDVVRVIKDMRPWRVNACWSARSVIELGHGRVDVLGIQLGDNVNWVS